MKTTDQWQGVVRSFSRSVTVWVVALGLVGVTTQAAVNTWTGSGGNFSDNGNWDTGSAPANGDGTAFTNNASYTVSFPSAPNTIDSNVVNGGTVTLNIESQTWTLTNGPVAFDIGQNAGATATVVQTSGTLQVASGVTNAEFVVGDAGAGTYILNGGMLSYSSIRVGNTAGSSGTFTVSGAGVTSPNPDPTSAGSVTVGTAAGSFGCSLIISNGASITTGTTTIGGNATASNTTVQVVGSSFWEVAQRPFSVGGFGTTLIVNNATISDAGTFLTGTSGGVLDTSILTNNAYVLTGFGNLRVGNGNGVYSNRLIVAGGAALRCDDNGTAKAIIIGASGASSNNTVLISSGGMITNAASITVGDASTLTGGNFNNLIVNDGGKLFMAGGVNIGNGALATGNVFQAGGPGAAALINVGTCTVGAGTNGAYNQVIVTNVAMTTGSFRLGNNFGAGSNSCLVLADTLWNFGSLDLAVGRSGAPSNLMTVVGGVITNLRSLTVGVAGGTTPAVGNTFVLSGGQINDGSITIGASTNDEFNLLAINGGSMICTGLVQVGGVSGYAISNTLTVAGGTIVTPSLRVRTTNSLVFTSGTLATGGSTIDDGANDGSPVVVGNGSGVANLQLAASGTGFHNFNNGLVITNNATLSGNGTILGNTTVFGTLSPGIGGVGQITTSNDVILAGSANIQYDLGISSDLTAVNGNLTLNGTLNVANSGGFGVGTYTLFTYTGTLTTNGSSGILAIGATPNPSLAYSVDISNPGVVSLDVSNAQSSGFATWQTHYFGCTGCSQAQPSADPYGKGITNTNQFLAGFNPTNTAAYPHIISIAKTNSNTDVLVTYLGANGDSTYTGGPGSRTNILEFTTGTANGSYSNNFVSTGKTNILAGGTGLGVVTNMVDSGGATNKPSRFYRVRVLLP
ncbi:MAG TPA: hypothetical protein VMP11_01955 [Verrucomicrobiae bacterium]|nr:hypothetical protein [Verrucomicrobiae bacterium]